MNDRQFSLCMSHAIACALWGKTLLLAAVTFLVSDPDSANRLGYLMMVVMGAAATMTVRGFFVRHTAEVRNAYELGRDYAAGDRLELHAVE